MSGRVGVGSDGNHRVNRFGVLFGYVEQDCPRYLPTRSLGIEAIRTL